MKNYCISQFLWPLYLCSVVLCHLAYLSSFQVINYYKFLFLQGNGSEVFNPPDKAVIASLAFHPTDKVLLIATSNKLYLWRWDQPSPFACITTVSPEEKVR